eukprot:384472-Rhodomonas_salina.1
MCVCGVDVRAALVQGLHGLRMSVHGRCHYGRSSPMEDREKPEGGGRMEGGSRRRKEGEQKRTG